MPLVEDDHVVETLTSNGADHPFDKWILPRGARCGKDLLDPVPGTEAPRRLQDSDRVSPPVPATRPVQKHKTNSRLVRRAVSIVIDPWRAPDLGRVGGDVGDSGSPYAQGKHRPATGCHAPGRRPGSRPGPHLDQNVLAGYAAVALASILDSSGSQARAAPGPERARRATLRYPRPRFWASRVASFPPPHGPVSARFPPLAQTWHSKMEIRDEYRK